MIRIHRETYEKKDDNDRDMTKPDRIGTNEKKDDNDCDRHQKHS